MVTDNVNHPSHYNSHPSGVECITITEHMNFNIGNAVKYLWRAGLKHGPSMAATEALARHEQSLEDLKKAAWYVNREIARLRQLAGIAVGVDHSNGKDKTVMVRARRLHDGTLEIIDQLVQEAE